MARKPEKRAHTRAPADLNVDLFDAEGTERLGVGRLLNVTEFGACVETDASLKGHVEIVVRAKLKDARRVDVPAVVMWTHGTKGARTYGLRFGDIPAMIKDFLRSHLGTPRAE